MDVADGRFCRTGGGRCRAVPAARAACPVPALPQLRHQKEDGERVQCGDVVLKFSIQLPKYLGGDSRGQRCCPGLGTKISCFSLPLL